MEQELNETPQEEVKDTAPMTEKPRKTRKKKNLLNVAGEDVDINALSDTAKKNICEDCAFWKANGSLSVHRSARIVANLGIKIEPWKDVKLHTQYVQDLNNVIESLDCDVSGRKGCCK